MSPPEILAATLSTPILSTEDQVTEATLADRVAKKFCCGELAPASRSGRLRSVGGGA
jgi:hypothetical protein